MTDPCTNQDDLKRKIRKLKKIEIKIRFADNRIAGDAPLPGNMRSGDRAQKRGSRSVRMPAHLVWDDFFDLRETSHIPVDKPGGLPSDKPGDKSAEKPAKYSLKQLAAMSKDEYKEVIGEFFWNVYFRLYRENGIMDKHAYDPDILSQLGLPFDADSQTVKKRFRDLAKRHHPDTGGDAALFIEFIEQFKKLDRY